MLLYKERLRLFSNRWEMKPESMWSNAWCLPYPSPAKRESQHFSVKRLPGPEQWGLTDRRSPGPHTPSAAPAPHPREGEEPTNRKGNGRGPRRCHGAAAAVQALAALLLVLQRRWPRSRSRWHLYPDWTAEPRATGSRLPGTELESPCLFPSRLFLSRVWAGAEGSPIASSPGGPLARSSDALGGFWTGFIPGNFSLPFPRAWVLLPPVPLLSKRFGFAVKICHWISMMRPN